MTLDQLRIFLEVATFEHVTRAAQALNMTQSAVSAAVSALEARHGVVLFNRIGRRIELTEAGRSFMSEARGVLRQAKEAERFLADLHGVASGGLRLHASQTVANYWLPRYLVRYRALNPQVDIALTPGNTRTVAGAILDGSCDLGIVEGEIENDKLIKQIVAQDRLVIVVSEHHPWADGRPVDVADLDATTWIMREQGSGTRAAFKSDIRALGQDPSELQVILEMPSNEACLAAVQVGQSATALSRRAVLPRLAEGAFHQVNFSLPVRHFTMIRHADHHVARSVRAMMDLLSEPSEVDEIV